MPITFQHNVSHLQIYLEEVKLVTNNQL